METQTVKWSVSLSDGSTYYEGKGDYQIIPGDVSPWQKLKKHIEKENLSITSLSLYTEKGQRFNLPSAGRNPKFSIFDRSEKVNDYRMFRILGADILGGKTESVDRYTVAEAIYKDKKLQIWVSEDNPEICWSVIV